MNGERFVLHLPLLTIERQFTLSRISSRFSRAASLAQYAGRPRGAEKWVDMISSQEMRHGNAST